MGLVDPHRSRELLPSPGQVGEGSMINPATRMPWSSTRFHCQEAYARVPGAGPKMTHWVGQVGDVLCELIMTRK